MKLLLTIQTICEMSAKVLKNTIQEKERKILIASDMIADMISNKKLNPIVTKLFTRGRKLNVSRVCISQAYFKVPKDVRLNFTHYFIMKIPNKRELQQTATVIHLILTLKVVSATFLLGCFYV